MVEPTHLKNMNVKMGSSSPNFWGENSKNLWVATTQFRSIRVEDSGCQRCQQFISSRVLFSEPRNIRKKNDLSTPLASVEGEFRICPWTCLNLHGHKNACFWHGSTFGSGSVIICWAFNLNKSAAKTWGWNESLEGVVDYLDVPGS